MLTKLDAHRTDGPRAAWRPWRVLGCVAMLVMCALALVVLAPGPAQAMKLHDGLSYAGGLKLDVYEPTHVRRGLFARKRPVVLYVHGGGWVKGDRKRVYSMPQWLTSRGYVFVAIDYRKVPQTTIDGQVRDVERAIAWVRRNIRRYNGDPNRIVLMGHSAGAHLSALAAATGRAQGLRGVIPNDVQAYDLLAYATKRGSIGSMFGTAFTDEPKNWVRWSPATHAKRNGRLPPHLILYSRSQGERRRAISIGYANLLKGRGTDVDVFHGTAYSHGAIAARLGRPGDKATAAIERFLARVTR
ncbi:MULTISPECIES: alpha/beta hydrolase [unclassified Roseitalea]|uniref:alpha/beta hydrolase n=1 Tax=unclassified Roseitalea TaxID=2639107 RepID=UPI00273E0982|nr:MULTISPECIES: alpha/beta hydrolase [unclassified Roseitalea]